MASTVPNPEVEETRLQPVASWWSTALVVILLVGLSIGGAGSQQVFVARHGRTPLYLVTFGFEWLVCLFVIYSAKRRQVTLGDLVGGRWRSFEDVLLDCAIAAGFWIAALLILFLVGWALGLRQPMRIEEARKAIGFLGPHTGKELALWVVLAATAGFCEEVIYRGLLQRQFASLANNVYAGVVAQAVLFGASHGYQGGRRMVLIGVFGALFGLLVAWRRSLRPGMIVHAWQDTLAGVAIFLLAKLRGW